MYVRHDKDCQAVLPQPGNVNIQDAYVNTYENWCVDYVGRDKDNATNGKTGCLPQDLDGLLSLWQPHNSDNSDRTPSPYINSPLDPETFIDRTLDSSSILVLGMEEDRDLILYNGSNTMALQLEDNSQVLGTARFT
mgnify:CR=1 FL=1|tara:strand:- start:276 stop:683 length:408 start_codon:yes stop_codon:yes gene_type:complete